MDPTTKGRTEDHIDATTLIKESLQQPESETLDDDVVVQDIGNMHEQAQMELVHTLVRANPRLRRELAIEVIRGALSDPTIAREILKLAAENYKHDPTLEQDLRQANQDLALVLELLHKQGTTRENLKQAIHEILTSNKQTAQTLVPLVLEEMRQHPQTAQVLVGQNQHLVNQLGVLGLYQIYDHNYRPEDIEHHLEMISLWKQPWMRHLLSIVGVSIISCGVLSGLSFNIWSNPIIVSVCGGILVFIFRLLTAPTIIKKEELKQFKQNTISFTLIWISLILILTVFKLF